MRFDQTLPLTTGVDSIPGLIGSAGSTGTDGDDTINGTLSTTAGVSTLFALDTINGGLGTNTLKISDITGATPIPGGLTVSNIQTVQLASAGATTLDTTAWAGVTKLNLTTAPGAAILTVAATTDVTVAGTEAAVTVTGGKSVTVAQSMDTAADVITINKAGDVTVTATKSLAAAGGITIGATAPDAATGAVAVTSTAPVVALALDAGATTSAMDTIAVTGGTTVSVTQNANSVSGNAATNVDNVGDIITQGAVTVTGGNTTTSVSVVQGDQVAAVAAKAAVAAVASTSVVTFGLMAAANDAVTVNGLTFTANKALTAEQVASAFANLTLADIQANGGVTANGTYTLISNTAAYTSGPAVGATVTYSAATTLATPVIGAPVGTAVAPTATTPTTATAAVTAATGVLGVVNGAVVVDDNATKSIATVVVDGYSAGATLGGAGAGTALNALTTLTLANSGGGAAAVRTSSTTLALTVNDVNLAAGGGGVNTVTFDAGGATLKALNVTTAAKDSAIALTAAAVTDLTVAGTNALNLTGSTLTALETVKVSGSAGLTLVPNGTAVKSIDTTATTGTVTATIQSDVATYTGGAGVDNVIFSNTLTGATKAVSLGGGDDSVTIAPLSVLTVPTLVIDGGAGTDTLGMSSANAAAATAAYAAKFTSFEKLSLGAVLNGATDSVDLSNLNNISYVISAGTVGTGALTLTKMANNGTLELTAAGNGATVTMLDATSLTADSLNIVTKLSTVGVSYGTVTVANVETISITTTDTVATTIETASLTLTADKATTVNLAGNAALNLTLTSSTAVTLVDGSTHTGALTLIANGATAGMEVRGGAGADVLTTSGNADVIVGNGGADQITVAIGDNIKIIGGAGADKFTITGSSSTDSVYTVFQAAVGDTTNVGVTSGDQFVLNSTVSGPATKFVSTAITLSIGATPSSQAFIAKAIQDLAVGEMGWFQYGGNTFIVREGNTNTLAYTPGDGDQVVMIVGLVDLGTGASYNSSSNILEIN